MYFFFFLKSLLSMSDQSDSIAQFINMTQATEAQARFFLESTQWDLQSALIQYFESNSGSTADTPAHKTKQTSSL